jgi:hypothetical protein
VGNWPSWLSLRVEDVEKKASKKRITSGGETVDELAGICQPALCLVRCGQAKARREGEQGQGLPSEMENVFSGTPLGSSYTTEEQHNLPC